MKCPNCNVNLGISNRSNVEIDYCLECRGLWLDRGELDKNSEPSSHSEQKTYSKGCGKCGDGSVRNGLSTKKERIIFE